MYTKDVTHFDIRQGALNGKLVIVFTQGSHHVNPNIRFGGRFSEYIDVMIGFLCYRPNRCPGC